MERIKHALLKAKEDADRHRQEPTHTSTRAPSSLLTGATSEGSDQGTNRVGGQLESRLAWKLAAPLFLGLAAVVALWVVESNVGAASKPEAMQTAAAPAPQLVGVTSALPAAPTQTVDARHSDSASASMPASTKGATALDKPPVPLNDQVIAAVEVWQLAWSKRDMAAYLATYSDAFTPADGVSRDDWIASRYRNVGGRKSIDVQIHRLQVLTRGDDCARVSFLQDYTSGSHRELGQAKTLDLLKDADHRWRIVGEWRGNPPPVTEAGKS